MVVSQLCFFSAGEAAARALLERNGWRPGCLCVRGAERGLGGEGCALCGVWARAASGR